MSETDENVTVGQNKQMSARLARSATEVGAIRKAVDADGLQLDPAAGRDICGMLQEQMDRVDAWLRRLGGLTGQVPLGRNPVGTAMAAKFAGLAEGEDGSFVGVLTRYRRILADAHDAVSDAMRRYADIDDSVGESFRNLADMPAGSGEQH